MKQSRHEKAIRAERERIEEEIEGIDSGIAALTERKKALEGQVSMLNDILDRADSSRGGDDAGEGDATE